MGNLCKLCLILTLCVEVLGIQSAWAQWVPDGVGICTAAGMQQYPIIVSDGVGGAIVAWWDSRSGIDYDSDIYAQRVDAGGNTLWMMNGVVVCTETGNQQYPTIASDGAGGAIVAWMDWRSGSIGIYAQRVDASGNALWTTNGVAVCTATGNHRDPTIVSDGASGAIITWSNGCVDIYAQRIDASGNALWTANGVAICTAANGQGIPELVSDGAGGAIIIWLDYRSLSSYGIYAQRVDANGNPLWAMNGVAICTADCSPPQLVSDGAGGAIITWSNGSADIYAQRVDASGTLLWTMNGVAICTAANEQDLLQLVSDGAGGAIITWSDYRSSSSYDIYAQRVDANGNSLWTMNGVAICTTPPNALTYAPLVSDGASGAIITWDESQGFDIYAQRVDADGHTVLSPEPPSGLTGTPLYYNNSMLALLVTWNRNTESNISNYNIYKDSSEDFTPGPTNLLASPNDTFFFDVQWRWNPALCYKVCAVDSFGNESNFALLRTGDITAVEGSEAPNVMNLSQNYPNPFNPSTEIRYYLPEKCSVALEVYDVTGVLVARLNEGQQSQGSHTVSWNGRDRNGRQASSGVYFYRLRAGKTEISKKMVLTR